MPDGIPPSGGIMSPEMVESTANPAMHMPASGIGTLPRPPPLFT